MRSLRILALILISAVAVIGQTNKGGISGAVTDPNGAVVPGATVTIINLGTNETQTITTSDDGTYSVRSLDPVNYSVTVEAPNFKKAVVSDIKVDTASISTVNVALEAGNIGEQVTIEASAPLLNTETGTTSTTVTERQIQDIPLLNRSVLDLAVTAPNVSGDAGSEDPAVTSGQPVPGFNLSINGGRPGSTAILADGVNNTGVGIARSVVSFTPETVQEFTVQTSAYSAEFGQTGGGTINITTKSGTNRFNGTALVYHRNPEFNARRFRTGTGPRPANNLRYTNVSISAGGPVFLPAFGEGGSALYDGRDRTFFFAAIEPRWRKDFQVETTLLPGAAERSGDFRNLVRTNSGWLPADVAARFNQTSIGQANIFQQFVLEGNQLRPIVLTTGNRFCQFGETPTSGGAANPQCLATNTNYNPALNVIPQNYLDPTAQRILQFLPTPGDYFVDDAGLVRNAVINRFVKQDETRYTVRLDHNITKNDKVNFRYTLTPAVGIRGFGSDVNGNNAAYSDASQYLLAYNRIFSPSIINDLRLNYTRGVFSEDFSPEFSINGGRNLAGELGLPALTQGGIPLFTYSGDGGYNAFGDIGSSGSTNNYNREQRYNLNDIVYYNRGNATWKIGVDISRAKLNVKPFFAASGGRYQFRSSQTSTNRNTVGTGGGVGGGNPFASFILGTPNVVDVRPLLLDYNYRWDSYAAFVQNDWKVRPNLTLNLGLRYSLQLPRVEENNLQGIFRPDLAQSVTLTEAQRRSLFVNLGFANASTAPIPDFIPTAASIPAFAFAGRDGRSRYITPADYGGIEPRFGFAYSPKLFGFDERMNMVIRGGVGVSHAAITGNNRNPNPDFGLFTQVSNLATGSSGAQNNAFAVRLSSNQPQFTGRPLEQLLGIPENGIVYNNSISIPGYAAPDSGKVPYSTNWNLSLAFEPFKSTVVELAYVGNKGTHLYLPLININPRNREFVELLEAQGLSADTAIADPLGRLNLLGQGITIQRGSVGTQFLGFAALNNYFNASGSSIRHAGYIDIRRRVRNGLTFTANYTFAKSIDDASDASPDTRVLETGVSSGHVSFGAPLETDRAISTFDIKHNFNSTFFYDLPFGKGRQFLTNLPGFLNTLVSDFSVSGVFRLQGGVPFLPYITDTNRLGGVNRNVRPNLVPGVPLKNPLFDPNCPIGNNCEPYINPAAFVRPARGSLGNAPRTLDVRAPMQKYFDFSMQKSFPLPFISAEGRRRIQLRVDLLNAFNRSNFRFSNTNSGGASGFTTGVPNESDFTQAELNAFLAANPGSTATLAQVNGLLTTARQANGGRLPLGFFSVPVPEGFATKTQNSFDITTLEGIKLYRLRQVYDPSFGTLREVNSPRYIQFGLKIFF